MAQMVEKPFMSGEDKDTMSTPSGPPVNFQTMHDTNWSSLEKMKRKAKENPSVPIGVAAAVGMLGWQAHAFKNKGRMKTSVFLIQTRVRAQFMVVGAMICGISYNLINDYVIKGKSLTPTPKSEREGRGLKKSLSSS